MAIAARLVRPRLLPTVASARTGLLLEPRGARVAIVLTVLGCLAVFAPASPELWDVLVARPLTVLAFALVTLALASTPVEVYGRGTFTFAGAGLLATAFTLGIGAAMVIAVLVAALIFLRTDGLIHRAGFNAASLALSAATGGAVFEALTAGSSRGWHGLIAAVCAGTSFLIVNIGLLSCVMAISESSNPLHVWKERFRWLTPYYLASGALALAVSLAYGALGVGGLAAFTLPPAFMMLSVRQYLDRTRASVEEVRRANSDLQELLGFARGLAANAHDKDALVGFAEQELGVLCGAPARILDAGLTGTDFIRLVAGGATVGWLDIAPAGEGAHRWLRMRDTLTATLATALESALLVDRVLKAHRDLVAALSRSMEAKDRYTSGHTERVAAVATVLAERLGYAGDDLEAIETGALVHDIGKIGVPERILNKPGPLDDEEWAVMKRHPVMSDYIIRDIDLHPFVGQAARWSHERIDGTGYPDGLRGDAIPLAARIIHMADAWDALTSDRPYRPARSPEQALEEIRSNVGSQFCPVVFRELEHEFRRPDSLLRARA